MRSFACFTLMSATRGLIPAVPLCDAPTGCYCNDPLAANFETGVVSPSGMLLSNTSAMGATQSSQVAD